MDPRITPGMAVYVMAPMTIYGTPHHQMLMAQLKVTFPAVEFIFAQPGLFQNTRHWLETIEDLLIQVQAGILLTDSGVIGKGCYEEWQSLLALERPVFLWAANRLVSDWETRLIDSGESWVRYARVQLKEVANV